MNASAEFVSECIKKSVVVFAAFANLFRVCGQLADVSEMKREGEVICQVSDPPNPGAASRICALNFKSELRV